MALPVLYEYKPSYYCDRCRSDVEPTIVEKSQELLHTKDGAPLTVFFRAAFCPLCGKTLCEREFDYAFVEAVKRRDAQYE